MKALRNKVLDKTGGHLIPGICILVFVIGFAGFVFAAPESAPYQAKSPGSIGSTTPPQTPKQNELTFDWWPNSIKDWVAIIGGLVGLIGGIVGLVSALRPPRIVAAHMDHLGVVVSVDRTTRKVHLPLVLSNIAKKPGAVTLLRLSMRPISGKAVHSYEWGLFWKEDAYGNRSAERRPAPIPVPGFSCVERSIQFESQQPIVWTDEVHEFTLEVRVGRKRRTHRISNFYTRPSADRLQRWYRGAPLQQALVDDIAVFPSVELVPVEGL